MLAFILAPIGISIILCLGSFFFHFSKFWKLESNIEIIALKEEDERRKIRKGVLRSSDAKYSFARENDTHYGGIKRCLLHSGILLYLAVIVSLLSYTGILAG